MSIVCIYQFEVEPRKGQTSWECLDVLRDVLAGWVRGVCRDAGVYGLQLAFDGGSVSPLPGQEIRTSRQECSTHRLATLEWTVPDADAADAVYQLSAVLAADEHAVEWGLIIHHRLPHFILRRRQYKLGPPNPFCQLQKLNAKLLHDWRCRIGGWPVPHRARMLGARQVEGFVRDILLNPARTLPAALWVVDHPPYSIIQPAMLQDVQDQLLGLAHVAALQDKAAAGRLKELLGPEHSLHGGVLRLYWPGFTRQSPPQPLKTLQQYKQLGMYRGTLHDLFNCLGGIGIMAYQEGRLLRAAREAIQNEQAQKCRAASEVEARLNAAQAQLSQSQKERERLQREQDEARQLIESLRNDLDEARRPPPDEAGPQPREGAEELSAELERVWDENDRLVAECEAARQRIAELEADLSAFQTNWALLWQGRPPEVKPDSPSPAAERSFDSVAAALGGAEEAFADVLTVWEDARRSAEQSTFSSPAKVFQALQAIAEVGRAYFEAQRGGPPLGPVDRAFAGRVPFKYTGFESRTTLSFFGSDRVFHHGEQSRQMQRHLTLGGGATNNCLQIYFDFDDAARRVLVGYCGRHLRYYRQRT